MKMHCVRLASSLLLSGTIAFGPAALGADRGVIYLAKAIGEESSPATTPTAPKPKQPAKPATPAASQPPPAAAKPATPEQPPKEATGMSTKTKIWIGAGVAALLAVAAGGGGGSSATPHP